MVSRSPQLQPRGSGDPVTLLRNLAGYSMLAPTRSQPPLHPNGSSEPPGRSRPRSSRVYAAATSHTDKRSIRAVFTAPYFGDRRNPSACGRPGLVDPGTDWAPSRGPGLPWFGSLAPQIPARGFGAPIARSVPAGPSLVRAIAPSPAAWGANATSVTRM